MSKFSGAGAGVAPLQAPVQTIPTPARTATGGVGVLRDAKSELYLLAIQNFVGESTFHETAQARDERFRTLIHAATLEDPEWVKRLVRWLRHDLHLRSVAVVAACEYIRAGGPGGRAVVDSACLRADEPAEVLGYWLQTYGRKLPQPVKRGAADAAVRLYTERSALKYDGQSRSVRMADVLELTHPKPKAPWQSTLFRYLLDKRHRGEVEVPEGLEMIRNRRTIDGMSAERFRVLVEGENAAEVLASAGLTWEAAASKYGALTPAFWHAMIPSMGYMALLRNLRNFDQAQISDEAATQVAARLADPAEVAASRQLPIRFLSAWLAARGMRWGYPLETALGHSLNAVPALKGRVLILLDCSASMQDRLSAKSEIQRWQAAAVFAHALAARAEHPELYAYSWSHLPLATDGAILRNVEALGQVPPAGYASAGFGQYRQISPGLWGGTNTWGTVRSTYAGHDRVVLLTDEQAHPGAWPVPEGTRMYTFNLAGYRVAHAASAPNHFTFGGLSDAGFKGIEMLECRRDTGWPF